MKKVLFLLMFPVLCFGQNTQVNTQVNTSTEVNVVNERDLVLSEKSTKVFTEFPENMSMYTDILIVDASLHQEAYKYQHSVDMDFKPIYATMPAGTYFKRGTTAKIYNILSSTIFNIQDPYVINKKTAKRNPKFLQEIKKESYLYLYVRQSRGKGDDINTSFMLRDYNRKLIYRATSVNTSLDEILEPLFNF